MPLDVLEEIFCTLDPASLVNTSRTTKSFRQLLLSPGYAHVWREAFARDRSGIPPPPDGMQARSWALLLFGGKTCEVRSRFLVAGKVFMSSITDSIANNPTLRTFSSSYVPGSARTVTIKRTCLLHDGIRYIARPPLLQAQTRYDVRVSFLPHSTSSTCRMHQDRNCH